MAKGKGFKRSVERKRCFAKIVCGCHTKEEWVKHCRSRSGSENGGKCCRDCRRKLACNHKCNRTFGECVYYITKREVPKKKLAHKVDPDNDFWLGGDPVHDALQERGKVYISKTPPKQ